MSLLDYMFGSKSNRSSGCVLYSSEAMVRFAPNGQQSSFIMLPSEVSR